MKTPPRIIAFSGKYGTGKDSAAEAVIRRFLDLGLNVSHMKFANALKQSCAIITGMPIEDQFSDEGKCRIIPRLNMSVARFQQLHGTVAREHLHPDIWVIPVLNACEAIKPTFCVISDCRFPNELKAIHEAGGIVIRLNRRADLISAKSVAGRDPLHVSETALDDCTEFDLVIENNGTNYEHIQQVLDFVFK
jgi:hypothetical protein